MRKQADEYIFLPRRVVRQGALLFFQLGLGLGVFLMLLFFASH